MMTFSEMKLRAEHIGGEIKQADADVREAITMRERAEAALNTAKDYEYKAIDRAAEKRVERDKLADDMASYVRSQGDAVIVGVDPGVNDQTAIFNQPVSYSADPRAISFGDSAPRNFADIPGDNADSVPVDGWRA